MDMDEDDDLYQPEEPKIEHDEEKKPKVEELEEGEEEDESGAMDEDDDDDSDIDIITERKDGTKAAPPPYVNLAKYSDIRNIPQRSASNDTPAKASVPIKRDEDSKPTSALNIAAPSADQTSAAASKSTIDINANPIHPAAGKPITQVNIDEDLPDSDKPWRKPGTDISDYFNYGFDEFTWALYAAKQESIRGEFGADAFAANNKKMMEDFNMMMMGGMGMQGGGGAGAGAGGGMDPSQMDPSQMAAMFSGMQNTGGNAGAQGNQGQNFGGGFGGNQGGFGYDQGMAGGGSGRGGFGGRGRRGRCGYEQHVGYHGQDQRSIAITGHFYQLQFSEASFTEALAANRSHSYLLITVEDSWGGLMGMMI
ncbi:fip1 motif domain-containing protein [Trichoderma breve]|uniref:Fip1 motif domain-containing protein n=1 Tax=Trichoderma breve TaxID=2034170 RepID=A0A9W9B9I0_9HYPO|nr:fip1 motif domain-containing protein [Trichoderma breve]KAJ4859103.1 fip1 motif domain-containing protein [Trichoderma breve]